MFSLRSSLFLFTCLFLLGSTLPLRAAPPDGEPERVPPIPTPFDVHPDHRPLGGTVGENDLRVGSMVQQVQSIPGPGDRKAHTEDIGIFWGWVETLPGIPQDLQHGFLAEKPGKKKLVLVRFSNAAPFRHRGFLTRDPFFPDPIGAAVMIFDIDPEDTTRDPAAPIRAWSINMTNSPALFGTGIEDFATFLEKLGRLHPDNSLVKRACGLASVGNHLLWRPEVAFQLTRAGLRRYWDACPALQPYFSQELLLHAQEGDVPARSFKSMLNLAVERADFPGGLTYTDGKTFQYSNHSGLNPVMQARRFFAQLQNQNDFRERSYGAFNTSGLAFNLSMIAQDFANPENTPSNPLKAWKAPAWGATKYARIFIPAQSGGNGMLSDFVNKYISFNPGMVGPWGHYPVGLPGRTEVYAAGASARVEYHGGIAAFPQRRISLTTERQQEYFFRALNLSTKLEGELLKACPALVAWASDEFKKED